jgi:hypothetical protein
MAAWRETLFAFMMRNGERTVAERDAVEVGGDPGHLGALGFRHHRHLLVERGDRQDEGAFLAALQAQPPIRLPGAGAFLSAATKGIPLHMTVTATMAVSTSGYQPPSNTFTLLAARNTRSISRNNLRAGGELAPRRRHPERRPDLRDLGRARRRLRHRSNTFTLLAARNTRSISRNTPLTASTSSGLKPQRAGGELAPRRRHPERRPDLRDLGRARRRLRHRGSPPARRSGPARRGRCGRCG